jgi:hypothetical protein
VELEAAGRVEPVTVIAIGAGDLMVDAEPYRGRS